MLTAPTAAYHFCKHINYTGMSCKSKHKFCFISIDLAILQAKVSENDKTVSIQQNAQNFYEKEEITGQYMSILNKENLRTN